MEKVLSLEDTVKMMLSEDYKERFKAEYYQLAIRCTELQLMIEKLDKRELEFKPSCPRSLYDIQLKNMIGYKSNLEARALIEGIDL